VGENIVPKRSVSLPTKPTRGEVPAVLFDAAVEIGRRDLTYGAGPCQWLWQNMPLSVLESLKGAGLAPSRLDAGSAGTPTPKRRPSGSHYQMRDAWFLGSDSSGREVFVRIDARRELQALDDRGRRLSPVSNWQVELQPFAIADRKRLRWTHHRDVPDSPAGDALEERLVQLAMPQMFIRVLMGIPREVQRAILEVADLTKQTWGDARACGFAVCRVPCEHDGPCERVVVAVLDASTLVVADAKRFPLGWDAWVIRGTVSRLSGREHPGLGGPPGRDQLYGR
jgi:hypothetical protein